MFKFCSKLACHDEKSFQDWCSSAKRRAAATVKKGFNSLVAPRA
jgi:hypothetical protein